ncbi:MAG: hypothetical protein KGL39_11940 [Patescibacteria group bacterium]|nr:hypothetical protein [Patescibacteria group bacterium]
MTYLCSRCNKPQHTNCGAIEIDIDIETGMASDEQYTICSDCAREILPRLRRWLESQGVKVFKPGIEGHMRKPHALGTRPFDCIGCREMQRSP